MTDRAALRWKWEERSNAVELDYAAMAERMAVGRRVARGVDWPEGSAADCHPGLAPGPGTVVGEDGGVVTVDWDCGGTGTYAMGLRRDGKQVYELKLVLRGVQYEVSPPSRQEERHSDVRLTLQ